MALSHAASGEKVHLPSLASAPAGGKTSALVKTDRFEAVHLVLRSGSHIPSHAVGGYMTLHCLEGTIVLDADRRIELGPGDWVYLERGEAHAVAALEDSSLLLTILFD
jgi:quercetin dioxygenase-like cupin family protein